MSLGGARSHNERTGGASQANDLVNTSRRYLDIAPFVPVRGLFSYCLPAEMDHAVGPGYRVVVPFGRRQVVGVVVQEVPEPPLAATDRIKSVAEVLDARPCLPRDLMELLVWAAQYYYAPLGELIRAALPSVLHGRQRQRLQLTAVGREALQAQDALLRRPDLQLSDQQRDLLAELDRRGGSVRRAYRSKASVSQLAELVDRGWIIEDVQRSEPPRPLVDMLVEVQPNADVAGRLNRSPRQTEIYQRLVELGPRLLLSQVPDPGRGAKALLRSLAAKGLVKIEQVERPRDPFAAEPAPPDSVHRLTAEQQTAVTTITEALDAERYEAFLVHGVTGSGKTEVYLQVIERALGRGRTALVLVPEIALTPQLAARFRARFGEKVAVLHSGLGDADRHEQWAGIRDARLPIVVGARSAVFAPLEGLGVVIVDEEHDSSFKQEEGVRYNGRDLALVRAKRSQAVAVLGSATPSMESYASAGAGAYQLIEMPYRATPRPLPTVEVVDLRRYGAGGGGLISAPLDLAIVDVLKSGQQAILFLNRRGFSTFVLCKGCGHAFRCTQCSVSLTHHRRQDRLICHYCGYSEGRPERCPACGGAKISLLGHGTEKLEQDLQQRYPDARVARLDRDTASGGGLRRILRQVQQRQVDVLVGTQIVTKGHDFPHVTLVGVLCADLGLQFPDFRAAERTFQLLTQVSGRAGRGDHAGRVLIQTYSPEHPAVQAACRHDYQGFYSTELVCRQEVGYPPAQRIIALHLDGEDAAAVAKAARGLAGRARAAAEGVAVLGPAAAPLQRLKGRTRWMMLLRAGSRDPLRRLVDRLLDAASGLARGVRVSIDVDPLNML